MASKSVVVVGGGVIGLCTAYYAFRKGHRVVVVERGAPDHDSCSLGNAGMIVPSHFTPLAAPGMVAYGLRVMWNPESPFYVRPRLDPDLIRWGWRFWRAANAAQVARAGPLLRDLSLESRRCFEEIASESGNAFGLEQRGLLMLCKSAKTLEEEAGLVRKARELGLQAELLNDAQTAERDPGVRMDVAGSVYFAQDCHLTPQRFIAEVTRLLSAGGVRFEWNSEVTGWRTAGTRVEAVYTRRGDLEADEYVVAGGAWSGKIVSDLGLSLPMQAGKGYSITLPAPRAMPALCSILTEARIAVTPMGGALRFGGTMEITGLDESIDQRRVDGIIKSVPDYLPEFVPEAFANLPVWRGLRPCSPDGLPYIGRFQRYGNLSAATGHAMMGLSLGPVTGKMMAAILSDEPVSPGIEGLSPDRYV